MSTPDDSGSTFNDIDLEEAKHEAISGRVEVYELWLERKGVSFDNTESKLKPTAKALEDGDIETVDEIRAYQQKLMAETLADIKKISRKTQQRMFLTVLAAMNLYHTNSDRAKDRTLLRAMMRLYGMEATPWRDLVERELPGDPVSEEEIQTCLETLQSVDKAVDKEAELKAARELRLKFASCLREYGYPYAVADEAIVAVVISAYIRDGGNGIRLRLTDIMRQFIPPQHHAAWLSAMDDCFPLT